MHRGTWRKKFQVSSLLPGQKFMSQYVTVTRKWKKLGDVPVNDIVKEQKKTHYENSKEKIKKQGRDGAP